MEILFILCVIAAIAAIPLTAEQNRERLAAAIGKGETVRLSDGRAINRVEDLPEAEELEAMEQAQAGRVGELAIGEPLKGVVTETAFKQLEQRVADMEKFLAEQFPAEEEKAKPEKPGKA